MEKKQQLYKVCIGLLYHVLFTPHMVKDLMLLGILLTHMLSCVIHRVTVNKC